MTHSLTFRAAAFSLPFFVRHAICLHEENLSTLSDQDSSSKTMLGRF